MKRNVKIGIWGFGAMGSGMAKMLVQKKGIEIVAVCDMNPNLIGKEMYQYLGVERGDRPEVYFVDDVDKAFSEGCCDLVLTATDSFVKDAFPKLKKCLEKKLNVISTAEEMSYPQAQSPELAAELDKIAKENGVTILGTGINPGLIMDLLVVILTGAMTHLDTVKAERVNSLSPFGKTVMEEQGVGITVEEFNKGVETGHLAGHVGFHESINMIADAVGWKVDDIKTQMSPIVTDVDRKSPHGFAAAGNVAGVNMTGQGFVNGKPLIDMVHPQQIEPEQVGVHTGDYITLKGTPEINMAIKPETEGGLGTIAMCVNMIPQVINASPGLKTMLDLPVPRALMGDVRDRIENLE
ncbi:MAG: NADP-binding protein [Clostridiales bacterium]|nr:MAG: NADP-binding protein [Clostridiales bacterium]